MKFIRLFFLTFMMITLSVYSLTVEAPKGSIVFYNGKLIGTVKEKSISFEATFPGELKVTKPGYVPFEKIITEDGTITVNLQLPAFLNISFDPPNSIIYIDNEQISREGDSTNISLQISPGIHEIKVVAPDFMQKTVKVELSPYEKKFVEISLKRTVTMKLNSDKPVKGAILNNTILDLPTQVEILPGKYKLYLPNSFVKSIQEIEVPALDEYSINIDTTEYRKLSLNGKPEKAYVKIGNEIFKLPLESILPEGTYSVEIFADGFFPYRTVVDLKNDYTLFYSLQPKQELNATELLLNSSLYESYEVLFDGYERKFLEKKPWLTSIRDKKSENMELVWVGFSDGSLKGLPSTVPIIITSKINLYYDNVVFQGPAIVQVEKESAVRFTDTKGILEGKEFIANSLTVIDETNRCLVNIYAEQISDVYWDNVFIGRTPIYLFVTTAGEHKVSFVKNGVTIETKTINVQPGVLNEIKLQR
ncbi:MAG: PEGA domain-containing protein [Fervidobacterium sp.]|uniref:PEGA domain-containing protein n=1 Tax=Fervidobacterium sp. TaxID=1871331 RepID=UPI004049C0FE